jgi:Tfp pilus assembly protein PilN
MIEINFLPHELKSKSKEQRDKAQYFRYVILAGVGLLIFVHLCLAIIGVFKYYRFRVLDNKWKKLLPQRKVAEDFKKEYEVLSADAQQIQQFISKRTIFSEKLNKLSLYLPGGVWFNELVYSPKEFILKGSVISLSKEELSLVNKFMDNLKKDAGFFSSFDSLELNSVQRRVIGGYEIIDFILTGKPK